MPCKLLTSCVHISSLWILNIFCQYWKFRWAVTFKLFIWEKSFFIQTCSVIRKVPCKPLTLQVSISCYPCSVSSLIRGGEQRATKPTISCPQYLAHEYAMQAGLTWLILWRWEACTLPLLCLARTCPIGPTALHNQ